MTTTLCFRANAWKAFVVGPGTGSASLKYSWSSDWQKYWERNNSCVQIICAPFLAACAARPSAFFRFAAGSGEHEVWIRPSLTTFDFEFVFVFDTLSNSLKGGRPQPD